jgi:extracellular solute-binding protein
MHRRNALLAGGAGALAVLKTRPGMAAGAPKNPAAPLEWPTQPYAGMRTFSGHTDTVLDVVGRIGPVPSLVIFTEGNHLMALLSDDVLGAFPSWTKSRPRYADLDLSNVVVLTLPQPILVESVRSGGIAFGNLVIEVSRGSGIYPDIFMGYPGPLRQLRALGVLEPQARYFSKNRGLGLMISKGNPLGIKGLADVVHGTARVALPEGGDLHTRCGTMADDLIGKSSGEALFNAEVKTFPGRLGIMHRDLPEMLARGYVDAAITWRHLVTYWTHIFPDHFEQVEIPGAEVYSAQIACARVLEAPRAKATAAFDEFLFERARDAYPRHDFARMSDSDYAAAIRLD